MSRPKSTVDAGDPQKETLHPERLQDLRISGDAMPGLFDLRLLQCRSLEDRDEYALLVESLARGDGRIILIAPTGRTCSSSHAQTSALQPDPENLNLQSCHALHTENVVQHGDYGEKVNTDITSNGDMT